MENPRDNGGPWKPEPGTRGALYVAFGAEYARVAAASATALVGLTGLRVAVATNLPDAADFAWPEGTRFLLLDLPDQANRQARVMAPMFAPFERSVLIDADALPTSAEIARPLDWLDRFDLCVVAYRELGSYADAPQWRSIREMVGVPAVSVYSGGLIYWRRNNATIDFFERWRDLWEAGGRGRDMAALFEALWSSRVRFLSLPGDSWLNKRDAVLIHEVGEVVKGLPRMREKLRPPEPSEPCWRYVPTRGAAGRPKPGEVRPAIAHAAEKFAGADGLACAEIGVWKGDHAELILNALQPTRLFLIDPWRSCEVDGDYGAWMLRVRGRESYDNWAARDWEPVAEGVRRRFAGDPRVEIVRAESAEAASRFADASLDGVYVDGRHDRPGCLADLRNYWPKVKAGGVLGGHDYDLDKQADVVAAVCEFAVEVGVCPHVDRRDFWFDKPEAREGNPS